MSLSLGTKLGLCDAKPTVAEGGGGEPEAFGDFDFQTGTYSVDGSSVALLDAFQADTFVWFSDFAPENISPAGWLFNDGDGFALNGALLSQGLTGATYRLEFTVTSGVLATHVLNFEIDNSDMSVYLGGGADNSGSGGDEPHTLVYDNSGSTRHLPGLVDGANTMVVTLAEGRVEVSLNDGPVRDIESPPWPDFTGGSIIFFFGGGGTLTLQTLKVYSPPL